MKSKRPSTSHASSKSAASITRSNSFEFPRKASIPSSTTDVITGETKPTAAREEEKEDNKKVSRWSAGARSLYKGKERQSEEEIDEWTTAEAVPETSSIPPLLTSNNSSNHAGARFSIKRMKSNSKLFSGGNKKEDNDPILPIRDRKGPYGYSKNRSSSLLSLSSHSTSTRDLSTRNGNLPPTSGRLGGWFNSILSPSTSSATASPSTPSTVPIIRTKHASSPLPISRSNSIVAPTSPTRLGPLDRMLDKAVQYLFDTDSGSNQDDQDIWVLGVKHPGLVQPLDTTSKENKAIKKGKNSSKSLVRNPSTSSSTLALPRIPSESSSISSEASTSSVLIPSPISTINGWPTSFYADFYSRLALTYRSGFPIIPCEPSSSGMVGVLNSFSLSLGRGKVNGGMERGLSSDAGWGCMLRTGQSLLANALMDVHLGRDWRRNLIGDDVEQAQLATYVQILTLFLDVASPLAPFSVHAFSQSGLTLGKAIGEWFGPSTASGAIKSLVMGLKPEKVKMGVVEANGEIYKEEVQSVSRLEGKDWSRPVLVLIGVRLGIDGVNPIYYDAIKAIFTFPQSVGIAGGRPSSSYYFVGAQGKSLIYIDPHHSKVAVPMQAPELDLVLAATEIEVGFAAKMEEKKLEKEVGEAVVEQEEAELAESFVTVQESNIDAPTSSVDSKSVKERLRDFYENAYTNSELRSYHCDKVRKMSFNSLDPSMLIGFLIKDEADWEDFSTRVQILSQSSKPIFAVANSPPSWMKSSTNSGPPINRQPLSSNGDFTTSDEGEGAGEEEEMDESWDNDSTEGEFDDEPEMIEELELAGPIPDSLNLEEEDFLRVENNSKILKPVEVVDDDDAEERKVE